MNVLKKFAVVLGAMLFASPAMACPILLGTVNQGPSPGIVIPSQPSASYVPPGYITAITVNGTHNFTITHTRSSDGLKTTTPATTGNPAVTLSGIADNGWEGTRITSLSYSGNTIRINGANEITVSGANPFGATQNWNGNSVSGVQEVVFGANGGATFRGFDLRNGQPVVVAGGLNLTGSCAASSAATVNGNTLALTASPSAGATSVQFFVDGAAVNTDNSSPFAFTTGPLSDGNHSYYAIATFPAGNITTTSGSATVWTPMVRSRAHETCAIVAGSLKCWGRNTFGQVGNGTLTNPVTTPQQVTGLTSGVTAVAVLSEAACAVQNGGVKCWGKNTSGLLGVSPATTPSSATPIQVIAANSGVTAIAGGVSHACVLQGSAVKCWGGGTLGQLGNGAFVDSITPVTAISSGATSVTTGGSYSCGVQNGSAKCWGSRSFLGDSLSCSSCGGNVASPMQVFGLTSGVTWVSAGSTHTCALHSNVLKCWGDNAHGELSDGTRTFRWKPVTALNIPGTVRQFGGGYETSCVILTDNKLYCWGDNVFGQTGRNTTSNWELTPMEPVGLTSGNVTVSGGTDNMCSYTNGAYYCWGDNTYGQIPGGDNPELAPFAVQGL